MEKLDMVLIKGARVGEAKTSQLATYADAYYPSQQSTHLWFWIPDQSLLQLARPLPTSYTIYVDGGWDSTDTDFYSAFQEQRDPTNRRGSAGIAIVPTGTDWQQQGAIVITLNHGVQVGSQPAHMELAAIIVGLALRRWFLPPQEGDTIYSDCKSITDVINSATPQLSKFPAKLPFLQAILHHLQALKQQGVTLD